MLLNNVSYNFRMKSSSHCWHKFVGAFLLVRRGEYYFHCSIHAPPKNLRAAQNIPAPRQNNQCVRPYQIYTNSILMSCSFRVQSSTALKDMLMLKHTGISTEVQMLSAITRLHVCLGALMVPSLRLSSFMEKSYRIEIKTTVSPEVF